MSGSHAPPAKTGHAPPPGAPGQPLIATTRLTPSACASCNAPRSSVSWRAPIAAIGVQRVAGDVQCGELELAVGEQREQPLSPGRVAEERQVRMRRRRVAADAELDRRDVALGAPVDGFAERQPVEGVGEQADLQDATERGKLERSNRRR